MVDGFIDNLTNVVLNTPPNYESRPCGTARRPQLGDDKESIPGGHCCCYPSLSPRGTPGMFRLCLCGGWTKATDRNTSQ